MPEEWWQWVVLVAAILVAWPLLAAVIVDAFTLVGTVVASIGGLAHALVRRSQSRSRAEREEAKG